MHLQVKAKVSNSQTYQLKVADISVINFKFKISSYKHPVFKVFACVNIKILHNNTVPLQGLQPIAKQTIKGDSSVDISSEKFDLLIGHLIETQKVLYSLLLSWA